MEGYTLVEFDFKPKTGSVEYEPLWADKLNCQAFGITLLQSGESLPFHFDRMVKTLYTYGVYAGHQSPYIGSARRRQLLTVKKSEYFDPFLSGVPSAKFNMSCRHRRISAAERP